jgi:hypothetical protein
MPPRPAPSRTAAPVVVDGPALLVSRALNAYELDGGRRLSLDVLASEDLPHWRDLSPGYLTPGCVRAHALMRAMWRWSTTEQRGRGHHPIPQSQRQCSPLQCLVPLSRCPEGHHGFARRPLALLAHCLPLRVHRFGAACNRACAKTVCRCASSGLRACLHYLHPPDWLAALEPYPAVALTHLTPSQPPIARRPLPAPAATSRAPPSPSCCASWSTRPHSPRSCRASTSPTSRPRCRPCSTGEEDRSARTPTRPETGPLLSIHSILARALHKSTSEGLGRQFCARASAACFPPSPPADELALCSARIGWLAD